MNDRLLSTSEACEYVGVTRETLAGYRDQGLPFIRINVTTLRYYRADIDRWLAQFRQSREAEQPTFQEVTR